MGRWWFDKGPAIDRIINNQNIDCRINATYNNVANDIKSNGNLSIFIKRYTLYYQASTLSPQLAPSLSSWLFSLRFAMDPFWVWYLWLEISLKEDMPFSNLCHLATITYTSCVKIALSSDGVIWCNFPAPGVFFICIMLPIRIQRICNNKSLNMTPNTVIKQQCISYCMFSFNWPNQNSVSVNHPKYTGAYES